MINSIKVLTFMVDNRATGIDLYPNDPRWINEGLPGKTGPKVSTQTFNDLHNRGLIQLYPRVRYFSSEGWFFITEKGRALVAAARKDSKLLESSV